MAKYLSDKYFDKTYEELLDLLTSKSSGVVFKSLCAITTKTIDARAQSILRHICEDGKTFKNRKLAFTIYVRHFPNEIDSVTLGISKVNGYVYFVQEKLHGYVKIGRARNLEKRFRLFITNLPFKLELLKMIKTTNYEKIELKFHELFHAKRLNGEWFKLDDEDIAMIKSGRFPEEISCLITSDTPNSIGGE